MYVYCTCMCIVHVCVYIACMTGKFGGDENIIFEAGHN